MRLFDLPQAKHFAASWRSSPSGRESSLRDYVRSTSIRNFREGTPDIEFLREALLNEAERNLYLAMANFGRVGPLLCTAGAHWAQVTLYYSAFFGARSLLCLFGGWIGDRRMLEVADGTPSKQHLRIAKRQASVFQGTHTRPFGTYFTAPSASWSLNSIQQPTSRFNRSMVSTIGWRTSETRSTTIAS